MKHDLLAALVRAISGVHARLRLPQVGDGPCVYFANHTSHLDFAVIWASIPADRRARCLPVAAKEYWEAGMCRRFIAKRVFRAVLIDRQNVSAHDNNPLVQMDHVLAEGHSLIIFPEGTRSLDGTIGQFKSGLYHMAKRNPALPFVPVCLENLNRILPKGELLPVPLLSTITIGSPLQLEPDENKTDFLTRAKSAIEELRQHEL
jgi:1-acyl-sn-glycerol-3-phosphate acyltransferase